MGLEKNSVDHLLNTLNTCDLFLPNKEVFYKLLLNALQLKDFYSFKNIINNRNQSVFDINYVYPSEETCLDIASKKGLTDFVKLLLHEGAKPNRINEVHNRAPIHFATENGHVDTLAALLEERTTNPDLEAGHQTALHIAVRRDDLTCAGLLLEKGANANIPNSKGLTALHLAAMNEQQHMVKLILEKSRKCPDIDTYKDYNDETTRDVLQQTLPDLLLPIYKKCEINVYDLKYYLTVRDETNFLQNLELIKADILHDTIEELLEMAAERNFYKAVIEILKKFEGRLFSVRKAAEAAVLQSHSDIFRELLRVEPEIANDLILNVCQQLGIPERQKDNSRSNRLECLKLILQQEDVDVHCTDSKGNTPLHYAARAGCTEAITLLLNRGSYIGHMNKFNVPPIRDIPTCVLSHYFDDCLQIRKEWTNEHMIEIDYRCLMPHNVLKKHDEARQATREIEIVQYIADNNGLKHLLKHPLLSSFLYFKWHNIRHVLYVYFILYAIFYVLLNAYILNISSNDSANENRTQIVNHSFNTSLEKPPQIFSYQDGSLRVFIIPLLLLFTFWEILQFIARPWSYLINFENLLHSALLGLTVVLMCGVNQVSTILILLSAWKLIILISQHKHMSTSVEMFRTIYVNYVRLFFPFVFFIVAFVLAFCTLFKDANFSNPMHSFFVMLTGEFDANNIPFVMHPIWSHIVFILLVFIFLFYNAIVLLNLLNGLAVSDTAEILSQAELIGLISSIRVIAFIEDIAMGKPFRYYFCCRNSGLLRWNLFGFLVKKIFLFPHYLRDGKLNVKLYDSVINDKCNELIAKDYVRSESVKRGKYWTLRMDPNITRQAKQIILNRNQLSDNEKLMMELIKLREQLKAMEVALISNLKIENGSIKNTTKSERKS